MAVGVPLNPTLADPTAQPSLPSRLIAIELTVSSLSPSKRSGSGEPPGRMAGWAPGIGWRWTSAGTVPDVPASGSGANGWNAFVSATGEGDGAPSTAWSG